MNSFLKSIKTARVSSATMLVLFSCTITYPQKSGKNTADVKEEIVNYLDHLARYGNAGQVLE
jgi:outer membrane biogenesis lipoprotein LolB